MKLTDLYLHRAEFCLYALRAYCTNLYTVGKQVIDEKEFLAFYESLMEREVLHVIFDQVRKKSNYQKSWWVKFGYSEKSTKFEKIFHLKFDATQ